MMNLILNLINPATSKVLKKKCKESILGFNLKRKMHYGCNSLSKMTIKVY